MKTTPIASGQATGQPGATNAQTNGRSASSERLAAAKAIASGKSPMSIQPSDTPVDPMIQRQQLDVRKLKMKTNFTTNRPIEEASDPNNQAAAPDNAIPDAAVTTQAAPEETKPLSPQFAALQKQKRALQVKERELADREAKLAQQPQNTGVDAAKLQADPLSVLREQGVLDNPNFYTALTEHVLANQGANPEILNLKQELKAMKEGIDKSLSDRDVQAEQQVYAEMRREATGLVASGDTYEMIRETKSLPDVMKLIERTWKEQGEVLDVTEALNLIETDLITESLKIANIKKVQGRLQPTPQPQQQQPQQRTMRTLTNRDGVIPQMDRRSRAIAAANGTLKK